MKNHGQILEEWLPFGLPERLENLLVREFIDPEMARSVIARGTYVHGLGPISRNRLAAGLGIVVPKHSIGRANSEIWSSAQWDRVCESAERLGYCKSRLSELPALVAAGTIPHPDIRGGVP